MVEIFLKKLRPFLCLVICITVFACTSQEEKEAFIGQYRLIEANQSAVAITLVINQDWTFSTNCSRFSCKTGKWDVSALPTKFGVVITFYNQSGDFCEQLHWQAEQHEKVLESQELEAEYVRRYERFAGSSSK
ncbi:MAG: hypothetical protein AAF927_31595 [Bacteroidota bacterium]